jgi:ABC-type polysaccharide/polyol phosphate transport system ATPase subunit
VPDYVIDIRSVSKAFQSLGAGYSSLKSLIVSFKGKGKKSISSKRSILTNLTLRIPKGNSVGVIGRNGSGKSTLLKLITGIYVPDTGEISVKGRVAALIELGAGFHPDFTGRENLHLGALLLGLTKRDLDRCFDSIVSFAELHEVIDEPVRTYSSGMFMRLGFSLAVHTNPDILLIDEVLAVGDAAFEAKCKDKIAELRAQGCTLLIVSHDLGAVERWCDEVLWLEGGEVKDRGQPRRVIDEYRAFIAGREEEVLASKESSLVTNNLSDTLHEEKKGTLLQDARSERWGSREIEIKEVALLSSTGAVAHVFRSDEQCCLTILYTVNQDQHDVVFGIAVNRSDGLLVIGTNTLIEKVVVPPLGKIGMVSVDIGSWELTDGSYSIDVAVHSSDGYSFDYFRGCYHFAIRTEAARVGIFSPNVRWRFNSVVA